VNRPSSARRLLFAFVVALLVHAGAVGLFALLLRRAPVSHKPPPLVVELRSPKRKPVPPLPSVSPSSPAPPAPDVEPVRPGAGAPASAAAAPPAALPAAPTVSLPAAPTAGLPLAPAPSASDAKAADAPNPATRGGMPGVRFSLELRDQGVLLQGGPKGGGAGGPGQSNGLVREQSAEEKLAEEKTVVEARIHGWVKDNSARQRADAPRDAYWQGIQDQMVADFHVDWDVLDKGGRRGGVASAIGTAAEEWQHAAAAYGKTGGVSDSAVAPLARGAGAQDGAFHHRLVTFVMVTQAEDGRVQEIHIEGGSGNRFYDNLALARARALSPGTLGVPPKEHRQTLWAFETDFIQIPPLPVFGCTLDGFIPSDCVYPLKKMVKTNLRLEAIY
jgi:hypothetical protein